MEWAVGAVIVIVVILLVRFMPPLPIMEGISTTDRAIEDLETKLTKATEVMETIKVEAEESSKRVIGRMLGELDANAESLTEQIKDSEERTTESITAFTEDVKKMYHIWFSSRDMDQMTNTINEFVEHLTNLSEMETFYQDATLRELVVHSRSVIEHIEQFKSNVEEIQGQKDG